jgi:hypothetical protein
LFITTTIREKLRLITLATFSHQRKCLLTCGTKSRQVLTCAAVLGTLLTRLVEKIIWSTSTSLFKLIQQKCLGTLTAQSSFIVNFLTVKRSKQASIVSRIKITFRALESGNLFDCWFRLWWRCRCFRLCLCCRCLRLWWRCRCFRLCLCCRCLRLWWRCRCFRLW